MEGRGSNVINKAPMQVARYCQRHFTSGRSRIPAIHICWLSMYGWTELTIARSPTPVTWPNWEFQFACFAATSRSLRRRGKRRGAALRG
jgi:hypothetical protein